MTIEPGAAASARPYAEALAAFHAALIPFRAELNAFPELADRLFADSDEWRDLLEYKLAPNLSADPCLVVAITGGTNTGKSTVYNLLLQRDTSPVRHTAAATCRPLLAANARRIDEFSSGKLLSAFRPLPLTDPEAVVSSGSPKNALYITQNDRLPDSFVLLDTPDIDSIDLANWEVADHIRAAGDVVIAVLTGEKYKDVRVVEYFRAARASGRVVLPLMNKANPANDYAVARAQVSEFIQDAALGSPECFVAAQDFSLADDFSGKDIAALSGSIPLFEHLAALEVAEIKEHVYRDTLRHFAREASGFLDGVAAAASELKSAEGALRQIVEATARRYAPKPGAQVGLLMIEFVQSKRNRYGRALGAVSKGVLQITSAGARALSRAVLGRDLLAPREPHTPKESDRIHEEDLKRTVDEVLLEFYAACDRLPADAATLVCRQLDTLDNAALQEAVRRDTVQSETISEDFRRHAFAIMDTWWNEEKTQRTMIQLVDATLAVVPALLVIKTIPGTGIGEYVAAAGSSFVERVAAEALVARFGGRIVPLIAPWQQEQRNALEAALQAHLATPALERLHQASSLLGGAEFTQMKSSLTQCIHE